MASRSCSRLSLLLGRVLHIAETPKPALRGSSGFRELSTSNLEEHEPESRTKESESGDFEERPKQSTPWMSRPSFGDDWTKGGQYGPQGVHKAILLGEVGKPPIQKTLKSGQTITLFSVGTGGMRNNQGPLNEETQSELQRRNSMQWHRVVVYKEWLGGFAMRFLKPGAQVYVEGNLETRIFNDPVTNVVKRIREITVRQNGRVMLMEQPPGKLGLI